MPGNRIYSSRMEHARKHVRAASASLPRTAAPLALSDPLPWRLRLLRTGLRAAYWLSPHFAVRCAYRLWTTPRRAPVGRDERRWLAQAQRLPFKWKGQPMAVYTWGEGEPVLLLHGWGGRSGQWRHFVDPLLAAGFRVVALDAPAHGASPGRRTTLPELTAVVCALAADIGPLRGLIAHSLGVACSTLALRQNLRAERVVAISPPARFGILLDHFTQLLALPVAFVERLRRLVETRFGARVWEELSADFNARALTTPALLIHDRNDRKLGPENGRALARAWRNARFVQTTGLGHRRILEDDQVVRLAVDFLRQ